MKSPHKFRRLRGVVRTAAFLLLLAAALQAICSILRPKQNAAGEALYREPAHSLDVLFMGSSHMLNGVSPMQLWAEYGIPSVNLGRNGQVLPVTYYALQEALRWQSPKAVVLDVYKVVQDSLIDSAASLHATMDHMRPGLPKLRAAQDLLPPEERTEYLLDIVLYHNRWKELTAEDFRPADTTEKGAQALFTQEAPYAGWTLLPPEETAAPVRLQIDYLDRIAALCREEGIELILVALPFTTPADDELNRQAVVNGMADYAQDKGLAFVNLMHRTGEMEFDFSQDMADTYHVNWQGMAKVTSWLGGYLAEHCGLPDRRGEEAYRRWNEALPAYRAYLDEKLAQRRAEAG